MHRVVRGHIYLRGIALGAMLIACTGCSFVKVPQGWSFNTGWSLEFRRMPFCISRERPCGPIVCEPTCAPSCETTCELKAGTSTRKTAQPTLAPEHVAPAPNLQKMHPPIPAPDGSAQHMNSSRCPPRQRASAGGGGAAMPFAGKQPQPAISSSMPVVAKFHPVPYAPVFCPQTPKTLTAKPVNYQVPANPQRTPAKKSPRAMQPSKIRAVAPLPEVVPTPPSAELLNKTKMEHAPRDLELPPEPPEWVFTATEKNSDKAGEEKKQSSKSTDKESRR